MKILSIGNSFSQDAQRYLHQIAKKDGFDLATANLYIGGCSLHTHFVNALENRADYELEFNSHNTGVKVSIKQVLTSVEWDVVTLQQASHYSPQQKTYFPYIEEVAKYVKTYCPNAKLFIHETWAYEDGSDRLKYHVAYDSSQEMLRDVKSAYTAAATAIQADGIIPCGTAMANAVSMGMPVHRDTFHASYGAGRYLLALTWYKTLTGKDISNNDFDAFDEPVSDKEREIVIKAVNLATT